jgi:EmrB/QacA subfamily drug resistance transporter
VSTAEAHRLLSWGGPRQTTNRIPRDYRWWALSVVLVVMFTASITGTVVSTAAPTIVADLHGFHLYGWIFSAYVLASTVSVPIFGKLSDIHGRRPLYLWGIALFVAGSILCGVATSMLWLIGARVVTGLGGGAMMALATVTIADIFSPRERGRWMGLVMSVFGLASIIGPTLGGAITDHFGWRWVFLVPVPVAVVAWLVAGIVMPRVDTGRSGGLDPFGCVLMVCGLVSLLLGFTWGGTTYEWSSWQELLVFSLAAVFLVVFVLHERRAKDPLLPPSFFRNRVFTVSVLASFVVVGAMYGALAFLPLFVQGVIGKTAQSSGAVLTPMMLSFVIGAIVAGQIVSRTGRYKVQAILGVGLVATGFALMTQLSTSSSSGEVVRDMVIVGIGIGASMPIFSMTLQSVFPHTMLGSVNSARQLFANLGGAITVPLMTTVVVNTFQDELPKRIPDAAKPLLANRELEPQALLTPEAQAAAKRHFAALGPNGLDLYDRFLAGVREAVTAGLHEAFVIGTVLGLAAVVFAFLLPRIELATWSDPSSLADSTPEAASADAAAVMAVSRR